MTGCTPNRVLVLGGTGFLGRHVVDQFAAVGAQVVYAGRRPLAGPAVRLDLVTDPAHELEAALRSIDPDVVVNCAGLLRGRPGELMDANVTAPLRLARAVHRAGRGARLIHLGSAAEYGAAGSGERPVREDDEPEPVATYGLSKLAGTRALLAQATDCGQDMIVLRVFNPIGAGVPDSTLPGRAAALLRQRPARLELGDLGQHRDFVGVSDVARAVVCAAARVGPGERIFNVGSGRATTSRELIALLCAAAGHRGAVVESAPGGSRSVGVAWQQADISRAMNELAWRPEQDLAESVHELWAAG